MTDHDATANVQNKPSKIFRRVNFRPAPDTLYYSPFREGSTYLARMSPLTPQKAHAAFFGLHLLQDSCFAAHKLSLADVCSFERKFAK